MNNETGIHQKLMDTAYSKYGNLSTEEWYKILTESEKEAVVLGNFNYQVCNGGVSQWIFNGYCLDIEFLISVLKKIGTENCLEIVKFLKKVLPKIDLSAKRSGCMGNYLKLKNSSGNWKINGEFENVFYSGLSDKFLEDCVVYFERKENEQES